MSDVAPSNHAGGRGTHGEGKESATADDDREGMRRKISSNHGLEAKNPGFRYHSSLNLIARIALSECYCTRRALDKTVPLRIQNRPPFLPNRIKMTQFSMGVAYVFDFSK